MTAEEKFRAAFERLKIGEPINVPKGTPVSQNNVSREAGLDRTALKKSRFPSLVAEIQNYLAANDGIRPESERQKRLKRCQQSRNARDTIVDLKKQRDAVAGLLVEANMQIAILTRRLEDAEVRNSALLVRVEPISILGTRPKSSPRPVDMTTQKTPKK